MGGSRGGGRHYEDIREQADQDFVTGLFNHRFMQVYLQRLVGADFPRCPVCREGHLQIAVIVGPGPPALDTS